MCSGVKLVYDSKTVGIKKPYQPKDQ